jgi:hypothetical protein
MVLSFDELQKKYGGLYIAIKNDEEVVASDISINALQKKMSQLKDPRGIIIRHIKAKIETPEVNGNEP